MKKLVATSAVLVALTSASTMAFELDVNHDTNTQESEIKLHSDLFAGIGGGIEFVGSDNLQHYKETTFSLDYKIDAGNFYVTPSFDLTVPSGDSSNYKWQPDAMPGGKDQMSYKFGSVAKFGLKAGTSFDNGIYTSARYRYEIQDGKGDFGIGSPILGARHLNGEGSHKTKTHRVDLTVGYNVAEVVDLSANYVVKRGTTKAKVNVAEGDNAAKFTGTSHDIELKAVVTTFGDLKPYVQYSYKGDTKYTGSRTFEGATNNEFKLGVNYTF